MLFGIDVVACTPVNCISGIQIPLGDVAKAETAGASERSRYTIGSVDRKINSNSERTGTGPYRAGVKALESNAECA